ncbi:thioester-containing protein 1 allele S3-like [Culex pipiens pallens]|uniref:thioester-containing protein 1 allele S3-like n=1 Tax=Culex pipiens pallens TaxID=42434 RepID=UPI001954AED4|nr:thioester-containing protein 1 allele S3-like [Culex pipiens pallens]
MKCIAKQVLFIVLTLDFYAFGSFIALVPTTIRDQSTVRVGLANVGSGSFERFYVTLERSVKSDNRKDLKSSVSVAPNEVKSAPFKIEKFDKGTFKISLQQLEGKRVSRTTNLQIIKRSAVIQIQTDKPIYKPGDTIKFRILVLNQELKPVTKLKSVNVKLTDSKRNLIREWTYGKLDNGVFQSQLELANFVPLGMWNLKVTAKDGEVKQKSLNVSEYVLPKHNITIKSPKIVTYKDQHLELIVDAMYTFGKPIKGKLTLTTKHLVINTNIDGRSKTGVELDKVLRGRPTSDVTWLDVDALLQEAGSDHQFRSSERIPIYKSHHKITLRKSSDYLLSDVPYKCWLILTDPFGKPLENPGVLKIKATRVIRFWVDKKYEMKKTPDRYGVVDLEFETSSSTEGLEVEVSYNGEITKFLVEAHSDDQRSFFQTTSLTERPKLGQPAQILVVSSFKMSFLAYYVIARGEIASSGVVEVKASRSATFTVTPNAVMTSSSVAIFTINNGDLMQSIVHLKVNDLNNFVNATLSKNVTEPREKLTLNVQSKPGSMIGLLAVDESVLLMEKGNDITKRSLSEDLQPSKDSDELEDLGFTVVTDACVKVNLISSRFGVLDVEIGPDFHRKEFPESWLWTDMAAVNTSGQLEFSAIVPDTITGWSISAIAVSQEHGLGLLDHPVSLATLKSFFITVNLAYSILKTEIAVVEVFLYNYLKMSVEATVELAVDTIDFTVVDERNQTVEDRTKKVSVGTDSVKKLTFLLKPNRSGNLPLTVSAKSASERDSVQKILRVRSGGIQYYRNEARFIEVDGSTQNFNDIQLVIPRPATPGTENITFSVEGILLGAALTNLNKLIRLPTGCGEQTMLNLVPSVLALEYMTGTGTLPDASKSQALDLLQKGYQNMLKYKLRDGSFSVFGQSDGRGSVFLTAFVAKTFRLAGKHITVDSGVVKTAYDWLAKQQETSGRFAELGKIWHQGIQGGLTGGVPLTAYTLVAFLEQKNLVQQYKPVVDKGVAFLASKINELKKPYELALVSYALQLANHPQKGLALDKLLLEGHRSDTNSSTRWWDDGTTSIETTAYALLTFMNRAMYVDAKPIMKWLVSQRYDKGGYGNTQNTFVGLQALADYSRKLSPSQNNYEIVISSSSGHRQTLSVNPQSSLISQRLTLPSSTRKVNVAITGTGTGVFQVAYQFNAPPTDAEPRFEIVKTQQETDTAVNLNICARYKPRKQDEVTNMVLMEVLFPSGYVVADETLNRLKSNKLVRKIETKRDETRLVLYFDSLPTEKANCVDVSGLRKAIVLGRIAGLIKVYDYYEPAREAMQYFLAKEMEAGREF